MEPEHEFSFLDKKKVQYFYDENKDSIARILKKELSEVVEKICTKGKLKGSETSVNGGVRMLAELLESNFRFTKSPAYRNYTLEAHTFVQEQEGPTGCDLLFTYEAFLFGELLPFISKVTPVQAKIAEVITENNISFLYCKDPNLKAQLENIVKISREQGLLLMYTADQGAFVIHAKDALLAMGDKLTVMKVNISATNDVGQIAELLAICTGGDLNMSPKSLKTQRDKNGDIDIEDYLEKFTSESDKKTGVFASKVVKKELIKKDKADAKNVAVATIKAIMKSERN